MPITEIDYEKREAFIRANQTGGILQNCIVHRTEACLERGAMYLGRPSNSVQLTEGIPSGGNAHICPECAEWLKGHRPRG